MQVIKLHGHASRVPLNLYGCGRGGVHRLQSFTTPNGMYCYTVMSFKLRIADTTFTYIVPKLFN